jgi:hypothetical protein
MKKIICIFTLVVIFISLLVLKSYYDTHILSKPDSYELTKTAYSKYGAINKYGTEVIPPIYDDIFDFYKGYTVVIKNDKYGMADSTGTIIIPPKYDYIWRCNGNLIPV